MNEQVMIYEVKSAAAANAELLFSDDGGSFFWNDRKFTNLEDGDYVFVVNAHKGYVLFTKFHNDKIPTDLNHDELISKFEYDGKIFKPKAPTSRKLDEWQNFIRLEIIKKIETPADWDWVSFGAPENTYLNGNKVNTDTSKNRLLNIEHLSQITNDEKILGVLEESKKNFEGASSSPTPITKKSKPIKKHEMNTQISHVESYIKSKGFNFKKEEIANFYLSLKTKPFVILAGISGTGKTKLPRLFAEAAGMKKEQVIQVPVRPDWTDSSDLIGYTSLSGMFISKPLTDAILKANEKKDQPFFFILDEMNLARVEHYFADFLSIIETRIKVNSKIITDALITESQIKDARNKEMFEGMYWPENIYLIGTVNMDETTHPFSRKVLDRANSIEMNTVELDWVASNGEKKEALSNFTNDQLKGTFIGSGDLTDEDKTHVKKELEFLKEVNDILKIADLHFAYRVRDEIIFYLLYAKKEQLLENNEALDFQLMQKILPRIHGSSIRTQKVLVGLINKFSNQDYSLDNPDMNHIQNNKLELIENSSYPKSLEKLIFMLERFDEDRFTSFWV